MKVRNKSENNRKPSTSRKAAGIATGATIALALPVKGYINSVKPISDERIEKLKAKMAKIAPPLDTYEKIKQYADDILQKTGLEKRGVKIEIFNLETLANMKPQPEPKNQRAKIKQIKANNRNKIFANGLNACFNNRGNKIRISDKSLYSAVFHEIGHAMNYNKSKMLRALQKTRKYSIIGMPLVGLGSLAVGLFSKKRKSNSKKPKTTVDFIHNNAGKLTFLTFVPVLLEEGIASIRGVKMAKPYLSQAQHKLHKRTLLHFFGSYMRGPVIFGGAIALGIFVKDKIVQHKKSN